MSLFVTYQDVSTRLWPFVVTEASSDLLSAAARKVVLLQRAKSVVAFTPARFQPELRKATPNTIYGRLIRFFQIKIRTGTIRFFKQKIHQSFIDLTIHGRAVALLKETQIVLLTAQHFGDFARVLHLWLPIAKRESRQGIFHKSLGCGPSQRNENTLSYVATAHQRKHDMKD